MNIKINISEDKELRDAVKNLIEGQVKSVCREEIRSVIEEILGGKLDSALTPAVITKAVNDQLAQLIKQELAIGSYGQASYLKTTARELVQEKIDSFFKKEGKILQ